MAHYKTVNQLSTIDAAYIAGIIDGEGSILLSRRHRNDNRQLVITVANTEINLLMYINEVVGAGRITRKRTTSVSHSPSATYSIDNRQAMSLLEQIVPYLKTYKAKRAQLVLENYIALTPRNGKYTKSLKEKRERFIYQFMNIVPTKR